MEVAGDELVERRIMLDQVGRQVGIVARAVGPDHRVGGGVEEVTTGEDPKVGRDGDGRGRDHGQGGGAVESTDRGPGWHHLLGWWLLNLVLQHSPRQ